MGYYVNATDVSVRIRIEDEDAAFKAMVRFNEECPPAMKRGGTVGEDGLEKKWFSWMREDFSEYDGLGMILHEMGFSYDLVDEWIVLTGWHGDKQGQEDLLMESIASWVKPGSFVEWVGEDCYRYRWDFEDGRLWVREGTQGWSEEKFTPTERRITAMRDMERFKALMSKVVGSEPGSEA